MEFLLTGVAQTADQVVETSHAISALFTADLTKIEGLKRAGISARQVHGLLRGKALISAIDAAKALEITVPTARAALNNLKELGIVRDISGNGKERLYIYASLVDILEKGAGPIVIDRSQFPTADDEYTPGQRRTIDARLADSEKELKQGRGYGPFNTANEMIASMKAQLKKRGTSKKSKRAR